MVLAVVVVALLFVAQLVYVVVMPEEQRMADTIVNAHRNAEKRRAKEGAERDRQAEIAAEAHRRAMRMLEEDKRRGR